MLNDYRRFEQRPRQFNQIVGNQEVIEPLTRLISRGLLPRLLTFTGPTGSGKTTLARLVAVRLLCMNAPSNQANPCGEASCAICGNEKLVQNPNDHCYLYDELDASDHETAKARFDLWRLHDPNYIVFIDETQELPPSLMLRLRKMSEDHAATIILATTHFEKLDDALRNRLKSYTYELRRPTPDEVADYLQAKAVEFGVKYDSRDQLLRVANGYHCEMRPCSKFVRKVLAETDDCAISDAYLNKLFPAAIAQGQSSRPSLRREDI